MKYFSTIKINTKQFHFCCSRYNLLCIHGHGDCLTCEDKMLFLWKAITFLCGCLSLFGVVCSLHVAVSSLCCVVYLLQYM